MEILIVTIVCALVISMAIADAAYGYGPLAWRDRFRERNKTVEPEPYDELPPNVIYVPLDGLVNEWIVQNDENYTVPALPPDVQALQLSIERDYVRSMNWERRLGELSNRKPETEVITDWGGDIVSTRAMPDGEVIEAVRSELRKAGIPEFLWSEAIRW